MFRPSEPRANSLLVLLECGRWVLSVEPCDRSAKVLLDALAHLLLLPIEHKAYEIKGASVPVVAALGYREDLPIVLYLESEFIFEVWLYLGVECFA